MTGYTTYSLRGHRVLSPLLSAGTTASSPTSPSPRYTPPVHPPLTRQTLRQLHLWLRCSADVWRCVFGGADSPPSVPVFSAADGGPVTTVTPVWLHGYRRRATASATASTLPLWHHLGDVSLVRDTASIQASQPMRGERQDGGGGLSALCVVPQGGW